MLRRTWGTTAPNRSCRQAAGELSVRQTAMTSHQHHTWTGTRVSPMALGTAVAAPAFLLASVSGKGMPCD